VVLPANGACDGAAERGGFAGSAYEKSDCSDGSDGMRDVRVNARVEPLAGAAVAGVGGHTDDVRRFRA
jgi:hypothetical protein